MKGNVKTLGNRLSRCKVMGLPLDLGVEVVPIRIIVPASNTNYGIFVGIIDDLHVPDCRVAREATSLFIKMES